MRLKRLEPRCRSVVVSQHQDFGLAKAGRRRRGGHDWFGHIGDQAPARLWTKAIGIPQIGPYHFAARVSGQSDAAEEKKTPP